MPPRPSEPERNRDGAGPQKQPSAKTPPPLGRSARHASASGGSRGLGAAPRRACGLGALDALLRAATPPCCGRLLRIDAHTAAAAAASAASPAAALRLPPCTSLARPLPPPPRRLRLLSAPPRRLLRLLGARHHHRRLRLPAVCLLAASSACWERATATRAASSASLARATATAAMKRSRLRPGASACSTRRSRLAERRPHSTDTTRAVAAWEPPCCSRLRPLRRATCCLWQPGAQTPCPSSPACKGARGEARTSPNVHTMPSAF